MVNLTPGEHRLLKGMCASRVVKDAVPLVSSNGGCGVNLYGGSMTGGISRLYNHRVRALYIYYFSIEFGGDVLQFHHGLGTYALVSLVQPYSGGACCNAVSFG